MSELTNVATAGASDAGVHPLVAGLRRRFETARAKGAPVRPFELRLPDRTSHSIGGDGEPAFSVRLVSEKGLAALAAFDELAIAEAYMEGDIDIEGEMLAALKLRSVLGDPHPLRYLAATFLAPLLLGQTGRDKKWIKSHYDVDPQFFVLWLDSQLRAYSHGFFEG